MTVAQSVYKLTIPSSTRYLEDVRHFVELHALQADLNSAAVEQLKIAVDEACTNVIEHAYRGEGEHQIDIAVIIKPDRLTIRIRDEGDTFDVGEYEEPDIFEFARRHRKGGFGVHIMRRLMDQVEYRTKGKVNECCMTKYRNNSEQQV